MILRYARQRITNAVVVVFLFATVFALSGCMLARHRSVTYTEPVRDQVTEKKLAEFGWNVFLFMSESRNIVEYLAPPKETHFMLRLTLLSCFGHENIWIIDSDRGRCAVVDDNSGVRRCVLTREDISQLIECLRSNCLWSPNSFRRRVVPLDPSFENVPDSIDIGDVGTVHRSFWAYRNTRMGGESCLGSCLQPGCGETLGSKSRFDRILKAVHATVEGRSLGWCGAT
jgi:hypothetical protein